MKTLSAALALCAGIIAALWWSVQPPSLVPDPAGSLRQQRAGQCPGNSVLSEKQCVCPGGAVWNGATCIGSEPLAADRQAGHAGAMAR